MIGQIDKVFEKNKKRGKYTKLKDEKKDELLNFFKKVIKKFIHCSYLFLLQYAFIFSKFSYFSYRSFIKSLFKIKSISNKKFKKPNRLL